MRRQKLNASIIRSMSSEERQRLLSQLRAELLKLRSQKERGIVENPGRMSFIRRAIARVLTIENEERLKERILSLLSSNKGKSFSVEEIARRLNDDRIDFIKHILHRLITENKVVRVGIKKFMLRQK